MPIKAVRLITAANISETAFLNFVLTIAFSSLKCKNAPILLSASA